MRKGVVDVLSMSGYEVISAADGLEGMEKALRASYDLLLLDLVMPGHTGFEILSALRRERAGQAVIVLSARGEENDRVKGLAMGADDYVVKPFSVRELLARVDAVLRRSRERVAISETVQLAGWEIDLATGEMKSGTEESSLSERECGILKCLLASAGEVVSRADLLRHVWGIRDARVETRTVDMHVAHLRKKLGDGEAQLIETLRGKGYRFKP